MNGQQVEARAVELFENGLHCAEAVRAWFADEYGCTRCGVVLEKLGEQQGNGKCIALAGRTAARFHAVLNADAPGVAAACSCTASQRPAAQTGCGCR